ncbi:MAG: ATP-binding protein [candidate division Zixibacteria bacterium]|jgi:signal transduction histidine kinase|nr:ATP-binding protein [candidate division Zixibacteria bacterium]
MWEPEKQTTKFYVLGGVIAFTLALHYGLIVEPLSGHVHWIHAIHGRFCYIPIVIAAAWFGLRGGLYAALFISVAVLPYIFTTGLEVHALADELTEIIFYFAIALLSGGLIEREFRSRKKAEDMRLQLEHSHKMSLVGQIAAGMAHEIKNPLASIKGAVEILCEDGTSEEDKAEFQAIVLKEVKRINASVTDFLEFARPSETTLAVLNLADVVRSSLKQIQPQALRRDIRIISHVEDPVIVMADEERIHQVMLNLLLNAVDASPDESNVTISLGTEESDARITIEDSGNGISEENVSKIFEPFFTTKSTGTGLGLAIAKSIVERHKGCIKLENNTSRGARAEIKLPLTVVGVPV